MDQPGRRFHAGSLRLDVPIDAKGTYKIEFDPDRYKTFLDGDQWHGHVRFHALIPAHISIAPACCVPGGSCAQLTESECASAGGTPAGSDFCEGDTDGDGVDGVCGDECPDDANKLEPGQCGCGNPDTDTDADGAADCVDLCPGDDDSVDGDGDGLPDCLDECLGVDNAIFAPECLGAIPTASGWGLIAMTLLLLSAGKIHFSRRRESEA